jgi:FkbM family methyltransferase
MNPSGSILVDALLGGDHGCGRLDKRGRPPLVIDVGAHIGWFSLLAASYGCRVVAFEPQPHAHAFLNASIAVNGFQDRIRLVRAAVTDNAPPLDGSVGTVRMVNPSGWSNWDITEVAKKGDEREGVEVAAVRVDDIVVAGEERKDVGDGKRKDDQWGEEGGEEEEEEEEEVLLFKIDAEGEEDAVLRSAVKLLARRGAAAFLIESKSTGDAERDAWKRRWFQTMVQADYDAFEFYEEVGRKVWSWDIAEHIFPIERVANFADWPLDQIFEDKLFVKKSWAHDLFGIVEEPSLSIEFPPDGHMFGKYDPALAFPSPLTCLSLALSSQSFPIRPSDLFIAFPSSIEPVA